MTTETAHPPQVHTPDQTGETVKGYAIDPKFFRRLNVGESFSDAAPNIQTYYDSQSGSMGYVEVDDGTAREESVRLVSDTAKMFDPGTPLKSMGNIVRVLKDALGSDKWDGAKFAVLQPYVSGAGVARMAAAQKGDGRIMHISPETGGIRVHEIDSAGKPEGSQREIQIGTMEVRENDIFIIMSANAIADKDSNPDMTGLQEALGSGDMNQLSSLVIESGPDRDNRAVIAVKVPEGSLRGEDTETPKDNKQTDDNIESKRRKAGRDKLLGSAALAGWLARGRDAGSRIREKFKNRRKTSDHDEMSLDEAMQSRTSSDHRKRRVQRTEITNNLQKNEQTADHHARHTKRDGLWRRANDYSVAGLAYLGGREERYYRKHWNDERYRHISDGNERYKAIQERRARNVALLLGGVLAGYVLGRHFHVDVVPSSFKLHMTPLGPVTAPIEPVLDLGDGDGIDLGWGHGDTSYRVENFPEDERDGVGLTGFWGYFVDDDPAFLNGEGVPDERPDTGEQPPQTPVDTPAPRGTGPGWDFPAESPVEAPVPGNPETPSAEAAPWEEWQPYDQVPPGGSIENMLDVWGDQVASGFTEGDSHRVYLEARERFGDDFIVFADGSDATYIRPEGDIGIRAPGQIEFANEMIRRFFYEQILEASKDSV